MKPAAKELEKSQSIQQKSMHRKERDNLAAFSKRRCAATQVRRGGFTSFSRSRRRSEGLKETAARISQKIAERYSQETSDKQNDSDQNSLAKVETPLVN